MRCGLASAKREKNGHCCTQSPHQIPLTTNTFMSRVKLASKRFCSSVVCAVRGTEFELLVTEKEDVVRCFSGLVYAADQGAFFAVSSTQGSLWRIDSLLRRGQKIPVSTSLNSTCGLALERTKTRRTLVLCARGGEGTRAVHLAPDQRSAYVRADACASSNEMKEALWAKR